MKEITCTCQDALTEFMTTHAATIYYEEKILIYVNGSWRVMAAPNMRPDPFSKLYKGDNLQAAIAALTTPQELPF